MSRSISFAGSVVLLIGLPIVTAVGDDRVERYLGTHQAYENLKYATWELQDTIDEARFHADSKKRDEFAKAAGQKLKEANAAIGQLRDAIDHLEQEGTWGASVKLFKERLKRYEEAVKEAAGKLPKGEPPKPSPLPPSPKPRTNPASPGISPPSPGPTEGGRGQASGQPRKRPRHVPLDIAVVQWDVKELLDELEQWEVFANQELLGQGLLERVRDAFARHGASHQSGWAQPWAQQAGMRTQGSVSMAGHWLPLTHAIQDFQSRLHYAEDLTNNMQGYLEYLNGVMRIWRKDIKRKKELKMLLIEQLAKQAAAGEADNQKLFEETAAEYWEILEEYNRKPPIAVKHFEPWVKNNVDLEKELAKGYVKPDRSTLSRDEAIAVINAVKKALKGKGAPTRWLDDLSKDPPTIKIDTAEAENLDASGLYQPLWNRLILKEPVDIAMPDDSLLGTLAHELFHAWYDTVPTWNSLWLTSNQEETVAEFLKYRLDGLALSDGLGNSVAYGESHGGTAGDSLSGLNKVRRFWKDEDLFGNFQNESDRDDWIKLRSSRFKEYAKETRSIEAYIDNF